MDEGKDCEVCGKGNARIFAIVEGNKLRVCQICAKFGKVVEIEKEEVKMKSSLSKEIEVEEDLAEDYAERIKSAREKKGWTRDELAAKLNEKESFLKKVELGEMQPTDKLSDKLEKALGIKLYEVVEITKPSKSKSGKEGTTLGDLIEIKKKKK